MRLPKVTEIKPKPERAEPDRFVTATHQLWPAADARDAGDRDSEPESSDR